MLQAFEPRRGLRTRGIRIITSGPVRILDVIGSALALTMLHSVVVRQHVPHHMQRCW